MRNPTNENLDDYFDEVGIVAKKCREFENEKCGCALLFHYVGHGAVEGMFTCMILNQKFKHNENPYPIESRLRSFTSNRKSLVLGTLNCCRVKF
jgi:hypothetical protein